MRISFPRTCMCWFRESMLVFELTSHVGASLDLRAFAGIYAQYSLSYEAYCYCQEMVWQYRGGGIRMDIYLKLSKFSPNPSIINRKVFGYIPSQVCLAVSTTSNFLGMSMEFWSLIGNSMSGRLSITSRSRFSGTDPILCTLVLWTKLTKASIILLFPYQQTNVSS